MRVVITGAAGFIGSRFAELLLNDAERLGYDELVVLDALTYSGRRENLETFLADSRTRFVQGSITDATITDEVLAGAHAVVHLAAESHVDRSITGARTFFETNVLGTQQLLESARRGGVERFVHVSTDEVYGSIDEGAWREDHLLEPNSPYSASKAGSDLAALAYASTYGLHVSVTRCSNNYGPRQFPEKVIPLFVTNLFDGAKVPLYGDGENVRDWLHVDDHARGLLAVLEGGRSGEIYNIGGGTELTNRALTKMLLELCGADESSIEPVEDRLGHDRRYSVDWGKIRDELGYRPRVDFEEGLAATVAWYRDHESWWRPLKGRA
ncbi:MAG: dTDP-glucose 4,6-dehydratase [Acidobacteriota bacterium]|nr:dTDP-glucose 4,6-dehydratase [Acidobacteriota bacterium]MDE3044254.1 dTDP-glucose 4,6-dehydratase [Acidobacteriota bacterium]MDE3106609.1 dTDP-glucose 4,6-dehydratase [Acidobacteriota bacterium]